MQLALDKVTIIQRILPHIPVAKRGFRTKSNLVEVVQCILYKLKTGCQWHQVPVKSFFTEVVLSYKSVFSHYRKWCKANVWKSVWVQYLSDHKSDLDLSHIDLDGSHSISLKGGADVSYQGRKKRKTCNSIFITDNQGIILAVSKSVKGEHHDLFDIESVFKSLMEDLKASNINLEGLFLNADAGFDSTKLRKACIQWGIEANICPNRRNSERDKDEYFDDELYRDRFKIERSNAWMDSYRSIQTRYDVQSSSWMGWNYLAMICIFYKKITIKNKSR